MSEMTGSQGPSAVTLTRYRPVYCWTCSNVKVPSVPVVPCARAANAVGSAGRHSRNSARPSVQVVLDVSVPESVTVRPRSTITSEGTSVTEPATAKAGGTMSAIIATSAPTDATRARPMDRIGRMTTPLGRMRGIVPCGA